jgi:DNA-binding NtrC family response regulator
MGQSVTRFDYDDSAIRSDRARAPLAVAIFADQPFLRAELAEDVTAAGLRVVRSHTLGALLDDPEDRGVDDLVLVDCPVVDAAELAALSRLDMLAARGGAQVVVSTSLDSLEAVFGCLDQSQPDILVAPSRADRMIALGRGLARRGKRVRELDDEDRLTLLRLTEQVSEIARTRPLVGEGDADEAVQPWRTRFPRFVSMERKRAARVIATTAGWRGRPGRPCPIRA